MRSFPYVNRHKKRQRNAGVFDWLVFVIFAENIPYLRSIPLPEILAVLHACQCTGTPRLFIIKAANMLLGVCNNVMSRCSSALSKQFCGKTSEIQAVHACVRSSPETSAASTCNAEHRMKGTGFLPVGHSSAGSEAPG